MRPVQLALLIVFSVATAASQEVQLSINFVPGGSAVRIVTGKVRGEWHGPTPLSPTEPVAFTFDLSIRAQSLITVINVTSEGDGVVVIQPQGMEVKGVVGDQPFELVITGEGDVKFSWGALAFDSKNLPEADRKKLQKLTTLSASLTVSPKGKIKAFQLPEEIKKFVPEIDVLFVNTIVTATLQTLFPALLPEKPVKVGQSWEIGLPVLIFETTEPLFLPITCTLAEIRGNEAVIKVSAEAEGDANLALKRWSEKDPRVVVSRGSFSANGEVIFSLSVGVPKRATWKINAEAYGSITPPQKDASPIPSQLRLSAEIHDELVF